MGLQSTLFVGNLTADPELRFTASGVAVAAFSLAVNSRYRNDAGEWVDGDPFFLRCNAWRDLAENLAESARKGTAVMVTGRLGTRSYEDKDGKTVYVTELTASEVGVCLTRATAKVDRAQRAAAATAEALASSPA